MKSMVFGKHRIYR